MQLNNCELNILVNGRRVDEFKSPMDFQTYIEGRDGSTFEIELVNNNPYDCEFIVSVDGLSITDGKAAGEQSGGYMVSANSRTSVPGWMVDGNTAAKFTFAGAKGGSYAEQSAEGDARNKGVIGAKVFARKGYNYRTYQPFRGVQLMNASFGAPSGGRAGLMRGMSKGGGLNTPLGSAGAAGGSWSNNISDTFDANMAVACASAAPTSFTADSFQVADEEHARGIAPVEQTLGTSFGEATDFNTQTVQFERGDLLAMIVLYYDDRQGLKRRGIDLSRKTAAPSPFPADEPKGCQPPAGWNR